MRRSSDRVQREGRGTERSTKWGTGIGTEKRDNYNVGSSK